MIEQEIEKGNKLIVEFMGFKTKLRNGEEAVIVWEDGERNGSEYLRFFDYQENWVKLMPVVERIASHNFDIRLNWMVDHKPDGRKYNMVTCTIVDSFHGRCNIQNGAYTQIEATWRSAVEFLTWHKTQQQ